MTAKPVPSNVIYCVYRHAILARNGYVAVESRSYNDFDEFAEDVSSFDGRILLNHPSKPKWDHQSYRPRGGPYSGRIVGQRQHRRRNLLGWIPGLSTPNWCLQENLKRIGNRYAFSPVV